MAIDTIKKVTPISGEDNLRERVCYRTACKAKNIHPGEGFFLVDLKSGKTVEMHEDCVDKRIVWQSIVQRR